MKSLDGETNYVTNNVIIESDSLGAISNLYNYAVQLLGDRTAKHEPHIHSLVIQRRFLRKPLYIAILETSDLPLLDILIDNYTGDNKRRNITLHFHRTSVDNDKLWKEYWRKEE